MLGGNDPFDSYVDDDPDGLLQEAFFVFANNVTTPNYFGLVKGLVTLSIVLAVLFYVLVLCLPVIVFIISFNGGL